MRLIIAGTRTIPESVAMVLINKAANQWELWPDVVLSGESGGVDLAAKTMSACLGRAVEYRGYPARWDDYGKAAGPIRNAKMIAEADALLLIWDGKSRGSADIRSKALQKGIPVYEVVKSFSTEIYTRYDKDHFETCGRCGEKLSQDKLHVCPKGGLRDLVEGAHAPFMSADEATEMMKSRMIHALEANNAELRALLAWCHSEGNFAHCDEATLARIAEIVKEDK